MQLLAWVVSAACYTPYDKIIRVEETTQQSTSAGIFIKGVVVIYRECPDVGVFGGFQVWSHGRTSNQCLSLVLDCYGFVIIATGLEWAAYANLLNEHAGNQQAVCVF